MKHLLFLFEMKVLRNKDLKYCGANIYDQTFGLAAVRQNVSTPLK